MKTSGLGPDVEPDVKEIRASLFGLKILLGILPWYRLAIVTMFCLPSQKPSRAWNSISSVCSLSGPASSTVRPSRLIMCLRDLTSCFRSRMRFSVYL